MSYLLFYWRKSSTWYLLGLFYLLESKMRLSSGAAARQPEGLTEWLLKSFTKIHKRHGQRLITAAFLLSAQLEKK